MFKLLVFFVFLFQLTGDLRELINVSFKFVQHFVHLFPIIRTLTAEILVFMLYYVRVRLNLVMRLSTTTEFGNSGRSTLPCFISLFICTHKLLNYDRDDNCEDTLVSNTKS